MAHLPHDIVAHILETADISIDAYLAFKDRYALKPRKITVDGALKAKLDAYCTRRSKQYHSKKVTPYPYICPISSFMSFDRNDAKMIQIVVNDYSANGCILICFIVLQVNYASEELWTIRKSTHDIHTGELCAHEL
jgi:hypothetical protein